LGTVNLSHLFGNLAVSLILWWGIIAAVRWVL
jgi:hypothetical protein